MRGPGQSLRNPLIAAAALRDCLCSTPNTQRGGAGVHSCRRAIKMRRGLGRRGETQKSDNTSRNPSLDEGGATLQTGSSQGDFWSADSQPRLGLFNHNPLPHLDWSSSDLLRHPVVSFLRWRKKQSGGQKPAGWSCFPMAYFLCYYYLL